MAQDKAQQLLSHLLVVKDSVESTNLGYNVQTKRTDYQLKRLNQAISIVEDSIRYRRAFFTIEE